jgi:hypothetical protein
MVNGYIGQQVIALQASHTIHVNSPYCTWRKLRPLPNYIHDDSSFLGCDAVSTGKWFPAFQRNMSPSSSGVDGPLRNAINLAFVVDSTLGWRQLLHLKLWGKNLPSNSTLGWRQHLPFKRWEPLTQQLYSWLKTATSFPTYGTTYRAMCRLTPQDRDPQ